MAGPLDDIHPARRFEAQIDEDLPPLDAGITVAIYRVVQETHSNGSG
jgi:signal transduction histidine kinase